MLDDNICHVVNGLEAPDLETKFAVSDHQWITYIITVFSDWTPSNFKLKKKKSVFPLNFNIFSEI